MNFFNCLPILFEYTSAVMKQSVTPDQIFDIRERTLSLVRPVQKRLLVSVLFPSPQGVILVESDEVDAFWGAESVSDVVLPASLLSKLSKEDIAKRRACYVAVVRLHERGLLSASNEPTTLARNSCALKCPAFEVQDTMRLKHRYTKEP